MLLEVSEAVLSIVPRITSGEPCFLQGVAANVNSDC